MGKVGKGASMQKVVIIEYMQGPGFGKQRVAEPHTITCGTAPDAHATIQELTRV